MKASIEQPYTEVFAWGSDEEGQLGLGDNRNKRYYTSPRFCSFNVIILEVSCGKDHSGMIAQNGYVYMMGSNSFGKLGINNKQMRNSVSPVLVEALAQQKATKISCGFNHTACVTNNGDTFVWGDNTNGQLGIKDIYQSLYPRKINIDQHFIDLSCGNYHTMCLNQNGQVYSFGLGEQGQLGIGNVEKEFTPTHITKLTQQIVQVVGGNFYTLFLTTQGQIWGCGDNSCGQLGIMPNKQQQQFYYPTKATAAGIDKVQFQKVDAKSYSAALTINNELVLFGSSVFGEYQIPKILKEATRIVNFVVGNSFGIAIDQQMRVVSWGLNGSGQLATNSTSPRLSPKPINALDGKKIMHLAAGEQHVIALGCNQGIQKSQSQSRVSSTDGRRSEQLSGKISRQQSAAQLNSLGQNSLTPPPLRNITEYQNANGKTKSHTEQGGFKQSKSQKKPFGFREDLQNENYQTLQKLSKPESINMYISNTRSITPTQTKFTSQANKQQPQQNDFASVNSIVASNANLFQENLKNEYNQKLEQLVHQLEQVQQQLNDKENQLLVVQSESHDTQLKLNRKIRFLEEQVDVSNKKLQKQSELEQEIQSLREENDSLKEENSQIKVRNHELEMEVKRGKDRKVPPAPQGPKQKLQCQTFKQKTNEDSSSFILSQFTEQTPQQEKQQQFMGKYTELPRELRSISPITRQQEEQQADQHIRTLSNYEVDESLDFQREKQMAEQQDSMRHQEKQECQKLEIDNNYRRFMSLNKLKERESSREHEQQAKNNNVHKVQDLLKQNEEQERRNQDQSKEESDQKLELLQQKIKERDSFMKESPKHQISPTQQAQQQIYQSQEHFKNPGWWSQDKEKKEYQRPQTVVKTREQSTTQQSAGNASEVCQSFISQSISKVFSSSYKQNLTTIKSRLTDLQRNKSALENRMRLFEERLKERKQNA